MLSSEHARRRKDMTVRVFCTRPHARAPQQISFWEQKSFQKMYSKNEEQLIAFSYLC